MQRQWLAIVLISIFSLLFVYVYRVVQQSSVKYSQNMTRHAQGNHLIVHFSDNDDDNNEDDHLKH